MDDRTIQTKLDQVFEDEGLELPPERGRSLFGAIFDVLDTPNRVKNAAVLSALQSIPGTENPEGYSVFDPIGSIKKGWQDELMGTDVIREIMPEIDVVENIPFAKAFDKAGGKTPSIADAFDIATGLIIPGMSQNLTKPFQRTSTEDDGFFTKRRNLKDMEENAEFLTRNVAGFAFDMFTDPLIGLRIGKKAIDGVSGLREAMKGEKFGEVVTKAGGKELTEAGVIKYAQKYNEDFARDLVKQVPSLSDKKKIVDVLRLNPQDTADMAQAAKNFGVDSHIKYANPNGVYDQVTDILKAAENTGFRQADDIVLDSMMGARLSTSAAFKDAGELIRKENVNKIKDFGLNLIRDPLQIADSNKRVREALDLGADVPITSLFSPTKLRYAGREVPILSDGLDATMDIFSASTRASALAFKKGADKVADMTGSIPFVERVADSLQGIDGWAYKALSPISRRIQSMGTGQGVFGSASAKSTIREHEGNLAFLEANVVRRATSYFDGVGEDTAKAAWKTFEDIKGKQRAVLMKNPNADKNLIRVGIENNLKQQNPEAFDLYKKLQADYKRYAEIETREGILKDVVEDYANRAYNLRPGVDDKRTALVLSRLDDKRTALVLSRLDESDFAMGRTIEILDDAIGMGFSPIQDPRALWAARTIAHERAMANKKFMGSMFNQFGLSPEIRQRIATEAKDDIKGRARNASAIAREFRVKVSPEDLINAPSARMTKETIDLVNQNIPLMHENAITQAFAKNNPVWGLPTVPRTGDPIDYAQYQLIKRLKEKVDAGDTFLSGQDQLTKLQAIKELGKKELDALGMPAADFQLMLDSNKFTFDAVEDGAMKVLWENYKGATERLAHLGRAGEFLGDRSGLGSLPREIKSQLNRLHEAKGLDKETLEMLNSDLPDNIIAAVRESFDNRKLFSDWISKQKAKGDSSFAEPLERVVKGIGTSLAMTRLATTRLFPGYWSANLVGTQLQGFHASAEIAQNLNPYNLMKNHEVFSGGADLITRSGERISNRQLMREMKQFEFRVSPKDAAEMMTGHADLFETTGRYLDKTLGTKMATEGSLREGTMNLIDALENFGRSNLYTSLRRQGVDPSTAAEHTNRALVDYKRGKTMAEKNLIAPLFFFYSFIRGETSNTLKSLVTNPGALMPQYRYAMQAAKLTEEDDLSDFEVPNLLYQDYSMARTFGRMPVSKVDKDGDPHSLISGRTPIEDVSGLLNFRLPSNVSPSNVLNTLVENTGEVVNSLVSRLSPQFKTPIQWATNKDLFTGRDLDDPFLSQNRTANIDAIKATLSGQSKEGIDPVVFQDNAFLRSLTRNVPPVSRLNSELIKLARSENPTEATLGLALGMKLQKLRKDAPKWKREEELKKALKSMGIQPEFTFTKSKKKLKEEVGKLKEG